MNLAVRFENIRNEIMADESLSDAELTPAERKRLRELLRNDDRVAWFWSTFRTWAMWVSGVATFAYASQKFIVDFFKGHP